MTITRFQGHDPEEQLKKAKQTILTAIQHLDPPEMNILAEMAHRMGKTYSESYRALCETGTVYSRPECIFHYCPSPDDCKKKNTCESSK